MNSGSSAFISSAAQSAGWEATPACQSTSRPGCMATRRVVQRLVHIGFERNFFAAAQAFVCGDDDAAVAIGDPARQRLGAEPGKDDRMDRADPGAGQHGDGGFGHHGQV
jgi:hypothetical protein